MLLNFVYTTKLNTFQEGTEVYFRVFIEENDYLKSLEKTKFWIWTEKHLLCKTICFSQMIPKEMDILNMILKNLCHQYLPKYLGSNKRATNPAVIS